MMNLYCADLEPRAGRDKNAVPDQLAALDGTCGSRDARSLPQAAERGKVLPEAGFELTSEEGEIIATAELAWPVCRIAVLLEHEADGARCFETAGWRVFFADAVLSTPEALLGSIAR